MPTARTAASRQPSLLRRYGSRIAGFFGLGFPKLAGFRTLPTDPILNTTGQFDISGQYALTSAAVWACCRLISNSIATLPVHILIETPDGKQKAVDHPLYPVLTTQPNPTMTIRQYFDATMLHLLLWGNAFTHVVRGSDGQVLSIWPLLPAEVRWEYRDDRTLDYYYPRGSDTPLNPDELIHFRLFTLDGLIGLSAVQYQATTFLSEQQAHQYAASIYANGGQRPSGVLKYPTVLKEEQVNKIRSSWASIHSAPGNVAILEGGASYESISAPLADLDYMAQNQFSIAQIARVFGVPMHLIAADIKPTYASIEQQSIEFVQYTLNPWIVALESSITNALLTPPYSYKFNLNGFERSDIKTRFDSYAVARQWGWMSANDIRVLEDLNRIPEGDIYLQPLNMVPAGTVVSPPAPTPPTGG
jgi:HK97 family phage portal protein